VPQKYSYVSIDFGKQVSRYLSEFKLAYTDLAKLIRMSSIDIQEIIAGKKGVVLITAEKISRVFGLAYYEFGNIEFPLPSFDELPENTKAVIKQRMKAGPPKQFGDHDLSGALDDILNGSFLAEPRTAKEILAQMPASVRAAVQNNAARITDLLKRKPRSLRVKRFKIDGEKELKFQLIEFVAKD